MAGDAQRAEIAPPVTMGAVDLRQRLAEGAISALDLAEACIARVQARDPIVRAWAWFDPEFVRHQARALDAHRKTGRPLGALHGLPVALKDIIDTARIPTENGSALDKGRVPSRDAFVVERLKAAGAIIMGKTVTTELAFMDPGPTTNPHDPGHTPGGSSSGSAAAVADGQVPLAIGTQTGGSVIRPASFCGITGFKPSFGAIPRRGVLSQSPSLDTLGVFAADPEGAALLADQLFGHDAADPATRPAPAPALLQAAAAAPPLPPVLAILSPASWPEAPDETVAAFAELREALGDRGFEVELPPIFGDAVRQREIINFAEMARHYHRYGRDAGQEGAARIGPALAEAMGRGNAILARDYLSALDWPGVLNAALDEVFTRCDAILMPAAPGTAPAGLGSTGSSAFNALWTLCGLPAVTVPILSGSNGLPMGVQLAGPRWADGRLLRTAAWLMRWAETAEGETP